MAAPTSLNPLLREEGKVNGLRLARHAHADVSVAPMTKSAGATLASSQACLPVQDVGPGESERVAVVQQSDTLQDASHLDPVRMISIGANRETRQAG